LSVWTVFAAALGTALATGLGAVPLLFQRARRPSALGIGDAIAAGMMTAASITLVYEGGRSDIVLTVGGLCTVGVFMLGTRRVLSERKTLSFASLRGADAKAALAIVGAMTIHSIAEGAGVGVAFGGGETLGLLIALAIAIHNIPEGLAVSLVLVPRGTTVARAAAWSTVTSLPQPLIAVPAFLFVEEFRSLLPAGLGFAAGAMVWIVVTQLLPDALRSASGRTVGLAAGLAGACMLALQVVLLGF
jgi:ZIP family zinc transporter